MSEVSIQEMNKCIAEMIGWTNDEGWIIPSTLSRGTDYCEWADTVNISPTEWRYKIGDSHLAFDWNANWQFEAKVNVCQKGYRFFIHTMEDCTSVAITDMAIIHQTHNYAGGNLLIHVKGEEREAIFNALYAMSQYLKSKN